MPSSWRFQSGSAGGRAEVRCVKSQWERPQSMMRCKWGLAHTDHSPAPQFKGEVQRQLQHCHKPPSPSLLSWELENCSLQTSLVKLCQKRSVNCLTFIGRILSLSGWGSEQPACVPDQDRIVTGIILNSWENSCLRCLG